MKINCVECGHEFEKTRAQTICSLECSAKRTRRLRTLRDSANRPSLTLLSGVLKSCLSCSREMPVENFHHDRRRVDGRFPYCKDCRRARDGRPVRQPPKYPTKREYDIAYRARAAKAADRTERTRQKYYWTQFRLDYAEYQRMFSAQDGRCAICGNAETRASSKFGNSSGRLAVDHDHSCCPGTRSCGKCVRGLLCRACNSGLGQFGDDAARIKAALDYLMARPASREKAG